MEQNLTRKDFLKLAGIVPAGYTAYKLSQAIPSENPNIMVVVFDAWSGHHLPYLGYPRDTTPHLNKLLDKAIVYHNHYSAGNSTTPGTASLLTGTYPWKHRAFNHDAPAKAMQPNNLFNAIGDDYHRVMYSHNSVANEVMRAFRHDVENYLNRQALFLTSDWVNTLFQSDYDTASVSWIRSMKMFDDGYANTLFLGRLYEALITSSRNRKIKKLAPEFPNKPPNTNGDNYFTLEDSMDWLIDNLPTLPQPFLTYFHFLPPHAPYKNTRVEFIDTFKDHPFQHINKPDHTFNTGHTKKQIIRDRRRYDEYILYVDAEFARLHEFLTNSGILENTWVILTSDHGELFERGIIGHTIESFFDPLIQVPMAIFGPGIETRMDIHDRTCSIDLLPTLAQLAGKPFPSWTEGELLPPFRNAPVDETRAVYAVNAKYNEKLGPITNASISMLKGNLRLSAYLGYEQFGGETTYELYDLENDPQERENIYTQNPEDAKEMVDELNDKLDEVNDPYL